MNPVEVLVELKTVSANVREHWRARSTRVERERRAVWAELRRVASWQGQAAARRERGRMVVTMTRLSQGELDDDNVRWALKATRDEVAAWLGVDDRDPRVAWEYAQERAPRAGVRVRIEARAP